MTFDFLNDLNPAQYEAVTHPDGAQLVIAGAGSGKTRVLTYKIAYLLANGVSASNILALTFTNKAAREMKSRIESLVGNDTARYLWMGTFHSICARILRTEANKLDFGRDFTIYDTTDTKSVVKAIVKEKQLDDKQYKSSTVLNRISWAKNNMYDPQSYCSNKKIWDYDRSCGILALGEIYVEYQKRLRQANAMDFDDLLFYVNILLNTNEEFRNRYQGLFQYILVDEYQDTNFVQYQIVKSLALPQNNICVVGDDAQSIYSFRGADIQNILNFQSDYSDSQLYKLERNYRSTQNIVDAANSVIKKNIGQIPKDVYSEKEQGDKIKVISLSTDREEASFVATDIRSQKKNYDFNYEDIAILYRTNAQSRVLEDEMRKQAIPYRIYGGLSFYLRKEIKDALAYIRLIINPQDEEALLRIINVPKRGIGDSTIDKIQQYAHENLRNMYDLLAAPLDHGISLSAATAKRVTSFYNLIENMREQIEKLDAYGMMELVLKNSGLLAEALMEKNAEGTDRYQNLDELRNSVREFTETQIQDGAEFVTIQSFLSEVALLTDLDQKDDPTEKKITLMTIHSAKGLEFPIVYIVGLEDNLFPSAMADLENNIEEERRLFYVAITRAMNKCIITYAKSRFKNGQVNFAIPSRFLNDIDQKYVEKTTANSKNTIETNQWGRFERNNDVGRTVFRTQTNLKKLSTTQTPRTDIESPFPINSRVQHSVFGAGTVLAAYRENENDKIEIQFDQVGKKTLLLRFVKLTQIAI